VWQQREQKEDDQGHHHDAKEALHQPNLEYDEQAVGAGFLGVASELERSTDSLSPLPDTRYILALGRQLTENLLCCWKQTSCPLDTH
jgi:hypothetical protein